MKAPRKFINSVWRGILFSIGCCAVIIGFIGIFIPGLPTVVFFLISLFCFTRSSPKMEAWLLNHPKIGPSIVDWREHGVITLKSKRLATFMICLSYSLMIYFAPLKTWIIILVGLILICVVIFILTRPSYPKKIKKLNS